MSLASCLAQANRNPGYGTWALKRACKDGLGGGIRSHEKAYDLAISVNYDEAFDILFALDCRSAPH